jgi:hypothetical protein
MIFINYEPGSKAYRAYDPASKKVHVTRDVILMSRNSGIGVLMQSTPWRMAVTRLQWRQSTPRLFRRCR